MAPTTESVVHYSMEPRASQFTVQAFASGLIAALAHSPKIAIRDWKVDVSFVPETLPDAKLRAVVKAASLDVLDDLRESDRRELHRVMNEEVLETRKFPEIVFESSTITAERLREGRFRVDVVGQLTLHGGQERAFFPLPGGVWAGFVSLTWNLHAAADRLWNQDRFGSGLFAETAG